MEEDVERQMAEEGIEIPEEIEEEKQTISINR